MFFDKLEAFDKEVYDACTDELQRQRDNIELIASENIVSEAVLLAAGSVLTIPFIDSLETAETVTLAVSPTLMPVNTSSATETCTSTAPFSAITTLGCAEEAMPPRSTFTAVTVPEHGAVTVPRLACLLIWSIDT